MDDDCRKLQWYFERKNDRLSRQKRAGGSFGWRSEFWRIVEGWIEFQMLILAGVFAIAPVVGVSVLIYWLLV